MKNLSSKEIRQMFLNFFEEKGHKIIPSASLIPNNDPTLLWNNAGVTPLKQYFDGTVIPENKRMVSCQKCIRTNDIESVGDGTHHTFFEMLGNFSIGDYFKKEAIEFSYELLTSGKYFGFDKDKLYMTVFPSDIEAKEQWLKVGVDPSHIIELKNNFWEIGEGPCGPDSEIFYDRGEEFDKENLGIKLLEEELENERYVEIWNNVFSQYNAKENLSRSEYPELPQKNIDTGMGLERIVCIIQNKKSNYDTDLFMPIINYLESLSNIKYLEQKEFRIIADHIRTVTFALGDGALFSNEGRGYVLRRLLRRAIKMGKKIQINDLFLYKLPKIVSSIMGGAYPYLDNKINYISELIQKEEILFNKTLESGEKKLFDLMRKSDNKIIDGFEAFKLYDTFGFPFELTLEILEENGFTVSKEEFENQMNLQKENARNARNIEAHMNIQNKELLDFDVKSEFVGYEKTEVVTKVIALIKDNKFVDHIYDNGYIILEQTPFYAEKGGQVSDVGYIYNDNCKLEIIDVITSPNNQNIHVFNVIEGSISKNDLVQAKINERKRENVSKNHSATHLLQEALKEVLNENVNQAGSKVDENILRFDFTYSNKIDDKDLVLAEILVNEKISSNSNTLIENMKLEEAKIKGAVALFEEKYQDIVRVITLHDSVELCGGTHVKNVGEIKKFAIKSFESKGSNLYRIEATTDLNIEKELYKAIKPYNDEMIKLLKKAQSILDEAKTNGIELIFNVEVDNSKPTSYKDVLFNRKEVENVREKVKKLEKDYSEKKASKVFSNINKILESKKTFEIGEYLILKTQNIENIILKQIVDKILENLKNGFIFIANINENNVNYISKSSKNLQNKINCGDLIKEASLKSNGNGGGSPTFASGGGADITNVDLILQNIENIVLNTK